MPLLPDYEEATSKEVWGWTGPYLSPASLAACCRVSRRLGEVFSPVLWADPTRVLLNSERPYERFDDFMATILDVRHSVRSQVIGMDFRPLTRAGLAYESTRSWNEKPEAGGRGWLSRVLEAFPDIKFLNLDGINHVNQPRLRDLQIPVDSKSVSNLKISQNLNTDLDPSEPPTSQPHGSETARSVADTNAFRTRSCTVISNTPKGQLVISMQNSSILDSRSFRTSSGQTLLYLDVSATQMRRPLESALLQPFDYPNLRILKARNVQMTDRGLSELMDSVGRRLFSLDVRNNLLTDVSVKIFKLGAISKIPRRLKPPLSHEEDVEGVSEYLLEPPIYMRTLYNDSEHPEDILREWAQEEVRPNDFDPVVKYLTGNSTSWTGKLDRQHLGHESSLSKDSGLTHLHISGNKFTSAALAQILSDSTRLEVFDIGSVTREPLHNDPRLNNQNLKVIGQPPSLQIIKDYHYSCSRLRNLRIHHSFVTLTPTLSPIGEYRISEKSLLTLAEDVYAADARSRWHEAFSPNCNPRIHTLTLTSIPRKSLGFVSTQLRNFIHDLAVQEECIATIAPWPKLSRRRPQVVSGLRVLRLEFAPAARASEASSSIGPSATEDEDADTFLAESAKDFSFFDSESAVESVGKEKGKEREDERVTIDIVESLREFRQATKAKLASEAARLQVPVWEIPVGSPHYHWSGRLEVILAR